MYRVVNYFTDLQDEKHEYQAGDTFPREGLKVTASRLRELSTTKNKRGIVLIEKVEEETAEAKPKASEENVKEYKPKRATRKQK